MSNTEARPYSAEQIEAMDPACIAGCSKTHIESVICSLLATVRALSSAPAREPMTDEQIYAHWPTAIWSFAQESVDFARAVERHHGICKE